MMYPDTMIILTIIYGPTSHYYKEPLKKLCLKPNFLQNCTGKYYNRNQLILRKRPTQNETKNF